MLVLLAGATLFISGCQAAEPKAGMTLVAGEPAVVVSLCADETASEISVAPGTDQYALTWLVRAAIPRKVSLVQIGRAPAGFRTVTAYLPGAKDPLVKVVVTVSKGAYWAWADEDWKSIKSGQVLIDGNYLSFADFGSKYAVCKQVAASGLAAQ
jgi:hypothetical protein